MYVEMRSAERIFSSCIHVWALGRALNECMRESALFFHASNGCLQLPTFREKWEIGIERDEWNA